MASLRLMSAPYSLKHETFLKEVKFLFFFKRNKTFARLLKDTYLVFELNGCTYSFTALAGFEWDGASIPKCFWSMVGSSFTGGHFILSVFHDLGYSTGCLPRKVLDDLFGEGIRYLGGFGYEKEIAVEFFGGSSYMTSKKLAEEAQKYCKLEVIEPFQGNAHLEGLTNGKTKIKREEFERLSIRDNHSSRYN